MQYIRYISIPVMYTPLPSLVYLTSALSVPLIPPLSLFSSSFPLFPFLPYTVVSQKPKRKKGKKKNCQPSTQPNQTKTCQRMEEKRKGRNNTIGMIRFHLPSSKGFLLSSSTVINAGDAYSSCEGLGLLLSWKEERRVSTCKEGRGVRSWRFGLVSTCREWRSCIGRLSWNEGRSWKEARPCKDDLS